MAFSATITNQVYLGPASRKIIGTWTGSAGDSAGTFVVAGIVTNAVFQKLDAQGNTSQILPNVGRSTSSGITTLTIQNQDTVTDGFFEISVAGN